MCLLSPSNIVFLLKKSISLLNFGAQHGKFLYDESGRTSIDRYTGKCVAELAVKAHYQPDEYCKIHELKILHSRLVLIGVNTPFNYTCPGCGTLCRYGTF